MESNGEIDRHDGLQPNDVRFFWIEGGDPQENLTYHWSVDCAWIGMALWRGGRLVTSMTPPPDAADTSWVWQMLDRDLLRPAWHPGSDPMPPDVDRQERWLCTPCSVHQPRPEAARDPAEEPCAKCLCSREMHISCRGPFDTGCGMRWADADHDDVGNVMSVRLIHCPCDGYEPPTGGRRLSLATFTD